MPRIVILDLWNNAKSGASKSVLYRALSKFFDIDFLILPQTKLSRLWPYVKSFHWNIEKWKYKKSAFEEHARKHPSSFIRTTERYSKMLAQYTQPYDALLQIGSLFGPVDNPKNVPYFSYSDSTVINAEKMWPDWMPDDFGQFRQQWYALEKNLFEKADGCLFYSHWAAETCQNEYAIAKDKMHVIGSACKITEDHQVDWTRRKKDVLFVSTDFKRKGGYKLIPIFEKIVSEIPEARLIIVGNVPHNFATDLSWLEIKGSIEKQELIEIYKGSNILIHPAKYDPFPSVIMEAANFEIPSVASNICAIPEIIDDGQTGYLINPDDIEGFQNRLIYLLKNRPILEMMGKASRSHIHNKYHPNAVATNIKNVIERYV